MYIFVIFSVLGKGVWPESKSFGEHGIVGPVPSKWKGGCTDKTLDRVPCNRFDVFDTKS